MKVLLHACCAPCAVKCIESLIREELTPAVFWYNPNIHPFTEYVSRRDTLADYVRNLGLELVLKDTYGLREFLDNVYRKGGAEEKIAGRCDACYALRLEAAAEHAARSGFNAFTTTLLISPYQKHESVRFAGERLAKQYGVNFLYRDFRPLFREGQKAAREMGMYMQKYCGCIFSEEERYVKA